MPGQTLLSSTELLQQLVSYDTTSYKSNLELIDFVANYLTQYGLSCERVYDPCGEKANLYSTLGPTQRPGVMLSGHTDVVPALGTDWQSNPFVARLHDDKLFARGSADMKGFIACVLAAVPALLKRQLQIPIHIALSYDEEVGCLGVRHLLVQLKKLPVQPAVAIIGEPTRMQTVIGHKGKTAFSVTVRGKTGHSAYTSLGVNAIEFASRLIDEILKLHRHKEADGPFDQGYRVPHTTLHVGTIEGGVALNVIPELCKFKFEIRNIPQDDPQILIRSIKNSAAQLQQEMQSQCNSATIEIREDSSYPGLHTDPSHPAVSFVQSLTTQKPIIDLSNSKVSFGTEAGLFNRELGIPAVVCGPGDIAQAHTANEFISLAQLAQCDQMLENLGACCEQELLWS